MKRSAVEKRVLNAVQLARMVVPDYGSGRRLAGHELDQLLEFGQIRVHRTNMRAAAFLAPPFGGFRRLYVSRQMRYEEKIYIELHEVGHALAGDADEPVILHFMGPLPEAEEVADLFALAGIITDDDCAQGPEWVEAQIRARAPLQDRGWEQYRVAQLTPKIIRLRRLIQEWL